MTRMTATRTTTAIPLIALLALAVAGCAPTPPPGAMTTDPRPTPTVTGTPIPVPTPTVSLPPEALDPLDTVTTILLQTDAAYFCDDIACAVDGFYYAGDPALAIAQLTAVFGHAPESERFDDGGGRFSEYHDWGGFLLYFSTDGGELLGLGVDVTSASVEGVAIETEHGVHVGTPRAEALALADLAFPSAGETGEIFEAHFGVVAVDANNWTAVIAFGSNGASGAVRSISAPIATGDSSGPAAGF